VVFDSNVLFNACALPHLCPALISTVYSLAIHREFAIPRRNVTHDWTLSGLAIIQNREERKEVAKSEPF
jgi:hypothetical protein